jgi:hypothetical protein
MSCPSGVVKLEKFVNCRIIIQYGQWGNFRVSTLLHGKLELGLF